MVLENVLTIVALLTCTLAGCGTSAPAKTDPNGEAVSLPNGIYRLINVNCQDGEATIVADEGLHIFVSFDDQCGIGCLADSKYVERRGAKCTWDIDLDAPPPDACLPADPA